MLVYELRLGGRAVFGLLIATLRRYLFNVVFVRLALDSSNWIKICLDSSSKIFVSYSFLLTLNSSKSSVPSLQ